MKFDMEKSNLDHTPDHFDTLKMHFDLVTQLVAVHNVQESIEDRIKSYVTVWRQYIPFERFSMSFFRLNHWYVWDEKGVMHTTRANQIDLDELKSASDWVSQNQKVLMRRDILEEQRFRYDGEVLKDGFRSDLIVPLILDGEAVGSYNFNSRAVGAYQAQHVEFARCAADTMAVGARLLHPKCERKFCNIFVQDMNFLMRVPL